MSHFLFDISGDLEEDCHDESADGVDHHGDQKLFSGRPVWRDGIKGSGVETTDQQAEALIKPSGDHEDDESPGQELHVVAQLRRHQHGDGDCCETDEGPHETDQFMMTVDACEQVDQRMRVAGHIGVEGGEDFKGEEEHVHAHGVGNDLDQSLQGVSGNLEGGDPLDDQHDERQDRGTGAERRSKEAAPEWR